MAKDRIPLKSQEEEQLLFGPLDRNAKRIRELYQVNLVSRDGLLKLIGSKPKVRKVKPILEKILARIRRGDEIEGRDIEKWLLGGSQKGGPRGWKQEEIEEFDRTGEFAQSKVQPRTPGQAKYLRAIQKNGICISIGPAGTGKTYLAVAMAVESLRRGEFRKMILARPAVEAGERLGFLPGDIQAKVNPYLRPIYDALNDLLDANLAKKYLENDVIEICPLAYMRGRTLNHSFIILDEGQNTTPRQMQMFLTRMGENSKVVVTGDITQTDLPPSSTSGLVDAWNRLKRIRGIAFIQLSKSDIVRHPLVQRIVEAYEKE